jgi:adenylosuccinate synthase
MGQVDIVVGVQWGDEGKGKWIDIFSANAKIISRFQGGNNAGHTIFVDGEKIVLHQVPSGILREERICTLASGTVINTEGILLELKTLKAKGIEVNPERLRLSSRAHVITPWHIYLDAKDNDWIGTTKKGIGPTYESKASRFGLRLAEFIDEGTYKTWLAKMTSHFADFANMYEKNSDQWSAFESTRSQVAPFVSDVECFLREQIKKNEVVLLEGAQGSLLDINLGSYPFVTSSSTVASGALSSIGFSPKAIRTIYGITKAYQTRVGAGPMPTELHDDMGKYLAEKGREFGATTGRPRRCGWLDLVALKYGVEVNGVDKLILNKVDILNELPEIKVCTSYRHPTDPDAQSFFAEPEKLSKVEPIYKTLKGWKSDLRQDHMPQEFRDFVRVVEDFCEVPIVFVGTGVGRDDFISLS